MLFYSNKMRKALSKSWEYPYNIVEGEDEITFVEFEHDTGVPSLIIYARVEHNGVDQFVFPYKVIGASIGILDDPVACVSFVNKYFAQV